jgi:hypothetical protein
MKNFCMAGEEGFKELSAVDPEAENLLQQAMEEVGKVTVASQPKLRPKISSSRPWKRWVMSGLPASRNYGRKSPPAGHGRGG